MRLRIDNVLPEYFDYYKIKADFCGAQVPLIFLFLLFQFLILFSLYLLFIYIYDFQHITNFLVRWEWLYHMDMECCIWRIYYLSNLLFKERKLHVWSCVCVWEPVLFCLFFIFLVGKTELKNKSLRLAKERKENKLCTSHISL